MAVLTAVALCGGVAHTVKPKDRVVLATGFLKKASSSTEEESVKCQCGFRNGFSNVISKNIGAVVNIAVTVRKQESRQIPNMDIPDEMKHLFEELFPGGKLMKEGGKPVKVTSLGSGAIISADGDIVTNYHVIKMCAEQNGGEITVTLESGLEMKAEIVGFDPRCDIALLKVSPQKPLKYMKFGDSGTLKVGQWCIAIGNPFGIGVSASVGIISKTDQNSVMQSGEATHLDSVIQTDAAINRGNSGGPLIDVNGEIIGINVSILTAGENGGSVGIGFAIPSNVAKRVVDQLKKYGFVKRGWIGVILNRQFSEDMAKSIGLPDLKGALIDGVCPDGPAQKAGIKPGDVILSLNDKPIENLRHFRDIVSQLKDGDKIRLSVWRNKKIIRIDVTVADLERSDFGRNNGAVIGPEAEAKKILGLTVKKRNGDGVVITDIDQSKSELDDFMPGDVILQVGQIEVQSTAQFVELLKEAKERQQTSVLLLVYRPSSKETRNMTLRLPSGKKGLK
ncbi:serine protease [Candidatus Hydrogenosomobacter endosymbioticus]|uniref:Serine protease n=2 Tax=Candidatus Hydrogenosomobacter endosymbioticus TaxID=2558174 RepID=A0ABM7V9A2_9PROT|nr:serine protease [Candidatus Hydrogenosomobacter endosymbioticus]